MNSKQLIEQRRRAQKRSRRRSMVLISAGAVLVLTAAVIFFSNQDQFNLSRREIVVPEQAQPALAEGSAVGAAEAPVVIVNYSDFACPYCAEFARTTSEQLRESYVAAGDVYLEFRSVGLLLGAPASAQAAEAAYCAADQEAFWPYHDIIFANQAELFANPQADISPSLKIFAELLALDQETFDSCLDGGKYQQRVQQDEVDARAAGVSGTPSFVINGTLLRGNQPMSSFQQVIESELAKAGE